MAQGMSERPPQYRIFSIFTLANLNKSREDDGRLERNLFTPRRRQQQHGDERWGEKKGFLSLRLLWFYILMIYD